MMDIPASPPVILPLAQSVSRPVWSVMIPVYNCSAFLAKALESVLVQALPEEQMQIEVVDDASTDGDIEALVRQVGKGRIKYFRQACNVGSLRNFETCINRSTGYLVHLLHGDDRVKQGYYHKMEALFLQYPEAGAAFSRYCSVDENDIIVSEKSREMDHDGILENWLEIIGERQLIQYAAITVRREVYEKLGAFYGTIYGEDWEMWVRIARHYPVAYTPEVLAEYRKHSNSISGGKFLTGEHLQDLLQVMQLIQQHLPDNRKKSILRKSKKYYAAYGLRMAARLWTQLRDWQIVHTQIREALKLHSSPGFYLKVIGFYVKLYCKRV